MFSFLLKQFGIELGGMTTTEKTLTESQINQNTNWEFGMTDASGNELTRLELSKLTGRGLVNLGNCCCLSLVVQSLFNGVVLH